MVLQYALIISTLVGAVLYTIGRGDERTMKLFAVLLVLTFTLPTIEEVMYWFFRDNYTLWMYAILGFVNLIFARYIVFRRIKFEGSMLIVVMLQAFCYIMAILEFQVPYAINQLLNYYDFSFRASYGDVFYYIAENKEFIFSLHYLEIIIIWMSHGRITNTNRNSFVSAILRGENWIRGLKGITTKEKI